MGKATSGLIGTFGAVLALLSATVAAVNLGTAPLTPTELWRHEREVRLTAPNGWLSLVGLHWLEPGTHRIGTAEDNDIVLAAGPAHAGTLEVDSERIVRLMPAPDAGLRYDNAPLQDAIRLHSPQDNAPVVVGFREGGSMQVHRNGNRIALRVRDPQAKTRTEFAGLTWFPDDPSWRIEARYEPHPPGKTIDIASITGAVEPTSNPGAIVFERDGRTYRLEALAGGDGQLWVIFADRTSGKETYGAGRFLYTDPPQDGRVVIDFNRAYSPPCAFTEFSTCPLPPPENRLDLAVTAGEKKYASR